MDPELVQLLAMLGDENAPPAFPSQTISRRRNSIKMDAPAPAGTDPNKWRKLPERPGGSMDLPAYPQPRPTQTGPLSLEEAVMASVAPQGPRLFDPSSPGIPAPDAPVMWEPSDSAKFAEFGPTYNPALVNAPDFEARLGLSPADQAALGPFNPDEEMLLAMFPDATPEEIAYIKASTSAGLRGEMGPAPPGGGDDMRRAIEAADAEALAAEAQSAKARGKSGTTLSQDIEQPNQLSLSEGDLDVGTPGTRVRGQGSMMGFKSPEDYLDAIGRPYPPGPLKRAGQAIAGAGRTAMRHPMKLTGGIGGLQLLASIINDPEGWQSAGEQLVSNPGEFALNAGKGFLGGMEDLKDEIVGIGSDAFNDVVNPRPASGPRTDVNRLLQLLGDVSGINPLAQAGNKVLGAIF